MIDFENVISITIPEGDVAVIARGDEILWKKRKYKRELAYLENTERQWIDTGYIPNATSSVEMIASGLSANSFTVATGTWFFGARAGYLNRAFGSYYDPSNSTLYYAFGNQMKNSVIKTLYNGEQKFYANSVGMYVNDVITVTATPNTFTSPVPLSLFGLNNNGSVISSTKYKMHYFKIWDNGVLVRDFIPVLDWNDRPCMYDKVTDTLFYNQGTGEFSYS